MWSVGSFWFLLVFSLWSPWYLWFLLVHDLLVTIGHYRFLLVSLGTFWSPWYIPSVTIGSSGFSWYLLVPISSFGIWSCWCLLVGLFGPFWFLLVPLGIFWSLLVLSVSSLSQVAAPVWDSVTPPSWTGRDRARALLLSSREVPPAH